MIMMTRRRSEGRKRRSDALTRLSISSATSLPGIHNRNFTTYNANMAIMVVMMMATAMITTTTMMMTKAMGRRRKRRRRLGLAEYGTGALKAYGSFFTEPCNCKLCSHQAMTIKIIVIIMTRRWQKNNSSTTALTKHGTRTLQGATLSSQTLIILNFSHDDNEMIMMITSTLTIMMTKRRKRNIIALTKNSWKLFQGDFFFLKADSSV